MHALFHYTTFNTRTTIQHIPFWMGMFATKHALDNNFEKYFQVATTHYTHIATQECDE